MRPSATLNGIIADAADRGSTRKPRLRPGLFRVRDMPTSRLVARSLRCNLEESLVEPRGIEPLTSCMPCKRLSQLS